MAGGESVRRRPMPSRHKAGDPGMTLLSMDCSPCRAPPPQVARCPPSNQTLHGVTPGSGPGYGCGMPPRPHLSLPAGAGAPSWSARARSAPPSPSCWRAAASGRRCRRARPSRPAAGGRPRERAYLPEVELPRELRVEPMAAGLARADYVFLGVPSRGLAEVIGNLTRHRPAVPDAGGLARQGPRAAGRPRRRRRCSTRRCGAGPRGLHRRPRPRARDGHRGRRARRRVHRRAPRAPSPRLHARGRRLRAVQRPRRRRAGGRGQERRRAGRGRHRGARA